MMNVRKLVRVAKVADTSSGGLAVSFKRNTVLNTVSRTKLFKEEEKLQKLREDTFSTLAKTLGQKGKKGGLTTLLGVLGIGGTGRAIGRFRGGGGGGLRGGGGAPKLPRGPLAKSLSKFGRIGPLAIASTGLDFFARKQSGQSNLQAGGGALAGLGGFAGGAKLGALLGTAVMPGVGTAVGGVLGGAIGGLVGGNLFDRLYGQNRLRAGADFRRIEEIQRTRQEKTLFGENLDKLEKVLDKFETNVNRSKFDEDFEGFIAGRIRRFGEGVKKTVRKTPPAMVRLIDTLFNALIVVEAGVTKRVPTVTPSLKLALRSYLMSSKAQKVSKSKLLFSPRQSTFLDFSRKAREIKRSLATRLANNPFFNKKGAIVPGQKGVPGLSKKGLQFRENQKFLKEFEKTFKNNSEFQFMDFLRKSNLESPNLLKIRQNEVFNAEAKKLLKLKNSGKITEKVYKERSQTQLDIYNIQRESIEKYGIDVKKLFDKLKNRNIPKKGESKFDMNVFMKGFRNIQKQYNNINKKLEVTNEEGGIMSGPDTGYLAVLHGKERIIPEENRYTRSKGQSQGVKQNIFIFQDENNNTDMPTQQNMRTPNTQVVPIFVPADPFDVATKYSELIAKVTV